MSWNPCVSVIIPTYNRAKMLPIAIQSVLDQSYDNIEIIIIDDGSTDNTREVLKQFQNKLKYIYTDHNGTAHARNEGMKAARGKYIAFLDSDDTYLPFKIALQVSFIESHPEVGMVYTEFSGRYESGKFDEYHLRNYHGIYNEQGWRYEDLFSTKGQIESEPTGETITYYIGNIFLYNLMDTVVPTNTILFPKSILKTVGYQNESYQLAQEYEFVVRICKHFNVAFLNIPTYVIYHHSGQSSRFKTNPFVRNKNNIKKEIDAGYVLLNTVMDWGYADEKCYKENRKIIDSRIAKVNWLIGIRWLEYGDKKKAEECFRNYKKFNSEPTHSWKYRWLFYVPNSIRKYLLMISYRFG